MQIFIDSADIQTIQQGLDLGWVAGVTTNPLLLAQITGSVQRRLHEIKSICPGPVFYQLIATDFDAMIAEAHQAQEILDSQLVVKLPPTDLGFEVCATLSSRMVCCPTAIYSAAQALVARAAGAQFLAVYVNRATRLLGDGLALVSDIAAVLEGSPTRLLGASLKSPDEAVASIRAGAHDLTLPADTLFSMASHPLSKAAVDQFNVEGRGLVLDQTQ